MEQLKHECGVAMIRLLKPLDYYEKKYGTWAYGFNKLYLMMETMLRVASANSEVRVPDDGQNLDGLNYLSSRRLSDINRCAIDGTIQAHVDGGVPVVEIAVDRVDEYTIGQLIYFFEFACGVSGYTLGVNPFDQPGVEAYKKNMFHLLGKPGF